MPYMKFKGIEEDNNDNDEDDPPHILEQIQAASQDCQRVWLFMDKAEDQDDTFLKILDEYPTQFDRFDDRKGRDGGA